MAEQTRAPDGAASLASSDFRVELKDVALVPSNPPLPPTIETTVVVPVATSVTPELPPAWSVPQPRDSADASVTAGLHLIPDQPAPPPIPMPAPPQEPMKGTTGGSRQAEAGDAGKAGTATGTIDPEVGTATGQTGARGTVTGPLPRMMPGPGIADRTTVPIDVLPVPPQAPPRETSRPPSTAKALAAPPRPRAQAPTNPQAARAGASPSAPTPPVPPVRTGWSEDETRDANGTLPRAGTGGVPRAPSPPPPPARPGSAGDGSNPGSADGPTVVVDLQGDGFLQVTLPGADPDQVRASIAQSQQVRTRDGRIEVRTATTADVARLAINVSSTIEAGSVRRTQTGVVFGADAGVSRPVTVTGVPPANADRTRSQTAATPRIAATARGKAVVSSPRSGQGTSIATTGTIAVQPVNAGVNAQARLGGRPAGGTGTSRPGAGTVAIGGGANLQAGNGGVTTAVGGQLTGNRAGVGTVTIVGGANLQAGNGGVTTAVGGQLTGSRPGTGTVAIGGRANLQVGPGRATTAIGGQATGGRTSGNGGGIIGGLPGKVGLAGPRR